MDTLKPGDMVMLDTRAATATTLWSAPFVGGGNDCHITGKLLIGETAMFIAYSSTKIDVLVLASGPKLGWVWALELERACETRNGHAQAQKPDDPAAALHAPVGFLNDSKHV